MEDRAAPSPETSDGGSQRRAEARDTLAFFATDGRGSLREVMREPLVGLYVGFTVLAGRVPRTAARRASVGCLSASEQLFQFETTTGAGGRVAVQAKLLIRWRINLVKGVTGCGGI